MGDAIRGIVSPTNRVALSFTQTPGPLGQVFGLAVAIPLKLLDPLLECFRNVPAHGSLNCFAIPGAIFPEEDDAVIALAKRCAGAAARALLLHRVCVPPVGVKGDCGIDEEIRWPVLCSPQACPIVLNQLVDDLVEAD